MITVACVEHGNYLKRGTEYVRKLKAMVARNLDKAHRFVCLTDDATRHPGIDCHELPRRERDGLSGWWAKCYLFTLDRFQERVLYLDLDSIVTGPLDRLVEHKGIIHLAQWGWAKNDYGSGVMVFDAGEHGEIWSLYTPDVPYRFRGDQDYFTALGGWPALPEGMTRSFRYHCKDGVPKGCSVVAFHGPDKPHLLPADDWIHEYWK